MGVAERASASTKFDHEAMIAEQQRPADRWIQFLVKGSWWMHVLVLLGAILGGGSLIRLYGDTCGLSLLDSSTWFRAFVTIGGPWCKRLNWVIHLTTRIVEDL